MHAVTTRTKNPINHNSKDAKLPPSADHDFTIGSGASIRKLQLPLTKEERIFKHKWSSQSLPMPEILPCGGVTGKVCWAKLFQQEKSMMRTSGKFANAILKLHHTFPNAPYVHTDLHLHEWWKLLKQLNTATAADIYWTVSRGVNLIHEQIQEQRATTHTPNYFDKELTPLVRQELQRVLQDKRIIPYETLHKLLPHILPPRPMDRIALGFIVKTRDDNTLKLRLIVDCSRGYSEQNEDGKDRARGVSESVNASIRDWSTCLPRMQEFARHLKKGRFTAMGDVSDAFMNIALAPHLWGSMTISFDLQDDGQVKDYCYTRLGFGVRSAVRIFQSLSEHVNEGLKQRVQNEGYFALIIHWFVYLDDYGVIAEDEVHATRWLNDWIKLMEDLGLPWDRKKAQVEAEAKVLGFITSHITENVTVDGKRLENMFNMFKQHMTNKHIGLRDLQSVAGHGAFIAVVVKYASFLLRSSAQFSKEFWDYASKHQVSLTSVKLTIPRKVQGDWNLFAALCHTFNGDKVTAPGHYQKLPGAAQSDASFWGSGGFYRGHYIKHCWKDIGHTIFQSKQHEDKGKAQVSTCFVEALGMRELYIFFAPYWARKYIQVDGDNSGLHGALLGEHTRSDQLAPILLDIIAILTAYNIKVKFNVIRTDEMIFADPLSRLSHPTKGPSYQKEFSKAFTKWKQSNVKWTLPSPANPTNPQALRLRQVWEDQKQRNQSLSIDKIICALKAKPPTLKQLSSPHMSIETSFVAKNSPLSRSQQRRQRKRQNTSEDKP